MITKLPINIDDLYITKPLYVDTFIAVLTDTTHHVLHRLYLVTNGIKDRQCFMELHDDTYTISAHVNTKHAYALEAKEQASVLHMMKPLVNRRPEYIINFSITDKVNMVEVFRFKHTTTNKDEVYNLINKLEDKIKEVI